MRMHKDDRGDGQSLPSHLLPTVWAQHAPTGEPAPVVFDSPHSGAEYPADFGHALPLEHLRSAEDMYVDELFSGATAHGVHLLCALFPRSYIDTNRRTTDLDASLLAEPWPEPLQPGSKSAKGKGLIRRQTKGLPLYARKLTADEVRRRLENFYHPYHDVLAELLAERQAEFGSVWHLNCHSWTPPRLGRDGQPVGQVDMCIGDRDGTTCAPGFTALVAETLGSLGYVVRVNRPFKGMELIRRHGSPSQGRHSLQLEVNRNLYMHAQDYRRSADFAQVQADLERLAGAICAYARAQV